MTEALWPLNSVSTRAFNSFFVTCTVFSRRVTVSSDKLPQIFTMNLQSRAERPNCHRSMLMDNKEWGHLLNKPYFKLERPFYEYKM